MTWIQTLRTYYRETWFPLLRALGQPEWSEYTSDRLTPLSADELQRFQACFGDLPTSVLEFYRTVGVGPLYMPNAEIADGPTTYRICDQEQGLARRRSALEQLEREYSAADPEFADCYDTGHKTGEDCRQALAAHRTLVSTFLPFMGPEDVYDFVYIVLVGPWKGRVGVWYHDYPVCELLNEPPSHPSFEEFGDHLNARAKQGDPIL